MPLSLYEGRKHQQTGLLRVIMALNVAFGVACIFWWSTLSRYLADAMRWATWRGIDHAPQMFDYPFVLLWLLPVTGIAGAWFVERSGKVQAASLVATAPMLLLGLVFGWYHLAPVEWH